MRTPLRYQATEYDCGPTAVLNAITYLYSTEEIPPDFVKAVYNYCLDEYNDLGCPGRHGTLRILLRQSIITVWMNIMTWAVREGTELLRLPSAL